MHGRDIRYDMFKVHKTSFCMRELKTSERRKAESERVDL